MQILNPMGNLADPPRDLLFGHFLFSFFEVFEECALLHVLQNQIDVLVVLEEGVEFEDVGVGHVVLELYL